jgi:hypothetical protein
MTTEKKMYFGSEFVTQFNIGLRVWDLDIDSYCMEP